MGRYSNSINYFVLLFFTKSKSFNVIGWSCINISYENLIILYELGVKKEENFRGKIMKKMFKIMAMLLVIAAVVSAAGCAGKTANTANNSGTSEEVTAESPVSADGGNNSEVAAEVAAGDNATEEVAAGDNTTGIAAEDVNETEVAPIVVAPADNETEPVNATVDNATADNATADEETF